MLRLSPQNCRTDGEQIHQTMDRDCDSSNNNVHQQRQPHSIRSQHILVLQRAERPPHIRPSRASTTSAGTSL
ncbi:MAG: hypothetical protein AAFP90_19540 [Planctomycetota bacterium]